MKIYKTKNHIILERESHFFILENESWDLFINDDHLFEKASSTIERLKPDNQQAQSLIEKELMAPIGQQELWASGVTYKRSKEGREEESKDAGGGDFYTRVYAAERPEIFFKATSNRIVGHGGFVRIRKDSTWDVPEPELTLMISSNGKIIGYTIGNDMSSRSIEGENPLYLPQAKTYDGCAALGPCIYLTTQEISPKIEIEIKIIRSGTEAFKDNIGIDQMKRKHTELVSYLYRECTFPYGSMLMTGTGIVPPNTFTLQSGDQIIISVDHIGTLINTVA